MLADYTVECKKSDLIELYIYCVFSNLYIVFSRVFIYADEMLWLW